MDLDLFEHDERFIYIYIYWSFTIKYFYKYRVVSDSLPTMPRFFTGYHHENTVLDKLTNWRSTAGLILANARQCHFIVRGM